MRKEENDSKKERPFRSCVCMKGITKMKCYSSSLREKDRKSIIAKAVKCIRERQMVRLRKSER